jgi:hypothetical protein
VNEQLRQAPLIGFRKTTASNDTGELLAEGCNLARG